MTGLHTRQGRRGVEEYTAITKLQRLFRSRRVPQRLHAKNLSGRLIFEGQMLRGVFRLSNQMFIFLLMVAAALMTGSPPERLGLYQHLEDAFRLDELSGTMSRRAFQEVRTLSK